MTPDKPDESVELRARPIGDEVHRSASDITARYRRPFFDKPIAALDNSDRLPAPCMVRWFYDMAAADGYLFLRVQPRCGTLDRAALIGSGL